MKIVEKIFHKLSRVCLKNAFCQMCVTIQASWTTNVQDDVEDLTRMSEA